MKTIYTYTDYRKFIKDFYEEKKSADSKFSYQRFSEMANIKSKGFLHLVISGKRSLSKSNIYGLSKAMKLSKKESDYFDNLVAFNEARDAEEKKYFLDKISTFKADCDEIAPVHLVRKEQYEFYAHYYHAVIRSLIGIYTFKDDYEWLAKKVYPKITVPQAKKSVALLEKLGFIRKDSNGCYILCDDHIATPPEVVSAAVLMAHKKNGALAIHSLENQPRESRNFSGMTVGVSKKTYERVCEEIVQFRKKVRAIVADDAKPTEVHHFNIQFFPMSNKKVKR